MNLFEPLGGQKIFMAYEVFGVWGVRLIEGWTCRENFKAYEVF